MSKTKKILSALLALVMVVGIMPAAAFAAPCELEEHTHGEGCYTLTCELSAHTHCYDDKCEIEAHKHTDCDPSCDKVEHVHCYTLTCEKAEHKHNDDCAEKVPSELVTDIDDLDFIVGVPQEFTFETKANDDAGVMVVGLSDFSDPDALAKLEYYEPNTDTWYDLNGAFGGSNGFPMADAASKFRATFAKAGEFTFTSVMKTVDGSEVLCSVEATAKVREYKHAELLTDINDIEFVVGVPQEFTYSTIANDDAGVMIVGVSDFSDPDAIAKLEYYEPNTSTWYELNGEFGGGAGFPAADATSKFRVTFAKAGEYEFTSVVKTVEGEKVLASVEATAVVREYKKAELVTNIDELEFVVGEAQEFTFSTVANDDAGTMVVGSSNFSDPDAIAKLEYYEVADGNWYELTGDFGPATGFPMMDATSKFRVTFAKAGEYDFVAVMKVAGTDDVLCEVEATAVVVEAELPEDPEEPEEPVETVEITEIAFEVAAPADGEAVSDMVDAVITTPDGVIAAEDVFVIWGKNDTDDIEDADWELVLPDDIFEKGAYYAAVVAFDIPEGVVIADDCVATINGEEFLDVYVDAGNEEYAPSFNAIYVFDDLVDTETPEEPEDPEEPETPVVPDVDGYETKCTKEEHKHIACDLSCDKEEHTHCFSDKCDKDHEHCYVKIEEEPEAPEYSIITGANGTWKDSSTDGMTFASDAEFADFVSVKVDGAVVDAANYDAKEGSTVITLKNAYLKTLKEGEHTLTIVSKDGEASTKFTIEHEHKLTKVEAKKETCTEKGNSEYYTCECGKWFKDDKAETEIVDKTSVEIKAAGHKAATEWSRDAKSHWHKCTVCGEAADEKKAHDFDKETGKICQTCKYDVDNPKTGSEAHITVMAVLMTMSVVVMAGVAGYFVWDKKRKH